MIFALPFSAFGGSKQPPYGYGDYRTLRRAGAGGGAAMKFLPDGTSEISLRDMKYASRMKYADAYKRNDFYFIFEQCENIS